MEKLGKKILIGVGAVAAVSFAAGALMYKRYMDDFYEFIMGEEHVDDMDMLDETGLGQDDFADVPAEAEDFEV